MFDPRCVGFDYLGRRASDGELVGFDCLTAGQRVEVDRGPADAGYFRFDTSLPGNSNLGHSFEGDSTDWRGRPGVLGPELTPDQRMMIIEYLKTLGPLPVRAREPREQE
jgi:hypothetical protein